MKKINLLLIITASLLIGLRFLWLDRVPVGMSHDELEYILSSKTFFKFGTDLSGIPFPISIFKTNTLGIISPLPYIILSPYYGLVHLNQLYARLPYLFLNLFTAVALYFLSLELFQKKKIAVLTSIVFLASPWSFYLSRVALEVNFALFFYCLGILMLLKFSGVKLIIPGLLFIFGFLSYQGAQPILPFIIVICIAYKLWTSKKSLSIKSNMIFLMCIFLFLGSYFFLSTRVGGSILSVRSSGLVFFDKDLLSQTVNDKRRLSVPYPYQNLTINKATETFNILTDKYLSAFSPDVLFLHGDQRATYRFGEHGLLYVIDLIFLIAGFIGLYNKKGKVFVLLCSILIIGPIATAISTIETSVINRSFMLLPIFSFYIAYGMLQIFYFLSNQIGKATSFTLLVFIYTISITNFLLFYFFRFPVIAHENFFMSERIIANYLLKNGLDKHVTVIAEEPRQLFLQTIFYSYSYAEKDMFTKNVLADLNDHKYKFGNVEFSNDCIDENQSSSLKIVQISKSKCINKIPKYAIIENHYGGSLYLLNSSNLCNNYSNDSWRRFYYISDYSIEKMSIPEFCNRWIFSVTL